MGIYGTPGQFPGLGGYMPQLPQMPPGGSPYDLLGAMAFSNMMAQNQAISGGLGNSLSALRSSFGSGGGPDPNLSQWVGPHITNYQQGDPYFNDIMRTGQQGIDLASQPSGGSGSALREAIQGQAQNQQFANYQAYTDQMQQLAFQAAQQQAADQQKFASSMSDALVQAAERGVPAGQVRSQLDAEVQGLGMQGAQSGLYSAFNRLYPGGGPGTGGRVSGLSSLTLLDPTQNKELPVLAQAVLQEMQAGHDPNAAMQNILSRGATDQALAGALSGNPATLAMLIQQMYAQGGQGGTQAQGSGVNTSAQPQQTGAVTDWDKTTHSLEQGLKWGGIGAGAGSILGPPGMAVGGAIGAAGGLIAGLLGGAHHETNPAMGLVGAAGEGVLGGLAGRLGLGGGLPSALGGGALSGLLENRLAGEGATGLGSQLLNKGIAGLSDTPTAGRLNPFLPGMPFGSMLRGGLEQTLGRTPWATGAMSEALGAAGGGISPLIAGNPYGPYTPGLDAMQAATRSGVPGVAAAGAPVPSSGMTPGGGLMMGMPGGLPGLAFASQEYAPPLLQLQQMIQASANPTAEQLALSEVTPEMWQQLYQNFMARGGLPG